MPNKYTKFKPFLLVEIGLKAGTYQQNIDIFTHKKAPIKSGLSA
jgi:hypothetical protein